MSVDVSDVVTYRVLAYAGGLRLMSTRPGFLQQGEGGSYGAGFACVRPGLMEQVWWGESPPTVGTREFFVARGLTWRLTRVERLRVRMMPANIRVHPFAACGR